jgi:hypothetical protein
MAISPRPRLLIPCKKCGTMFLALQSQIDRRLAKYCTRLCYKTPNLELDKERFWKHVNKTESCWLWTGGLSQGYGAFHINRKKQDAHRLAWIFTHGSIPDGLCVLHNCPGGDNRACCNPAHLWLGTKLDNNRDMIAKGTFRGGKRMTLEAAPRE